MVSVTKLFVVGEVQSACTCAFAVVLIGGTQGTCTVPSARMLKTHSAHLPVVLRGEAFNCMMARVLAALGAFKAGPAGDENSNASPKADR